MKITREASSGVQLQLKWQISEIESDDSYRNTLFNKKDLFSEEIIICMGLP